MPESDPFDVTQQHLPATTPAEAAENEPRKQIGRYRVVRVLGRGGFGTVYLAQDEKLDRLVAVKVPHAKHLAERQDLEIYLAEARTVANLDHPNIVPVHDVGGSKDCPCFVVSKYIEGDDLASLLQSSRLDYLDAVELTATIADALHHAHKHGIVHRDIKPGNILIAEDGRPYVVDFGLALREENIGKGPRWAGTPAYMSPEQARREGHRVDGRSDIFSLGVLFYELLSGRRPFKADTQAELLEQVTSFEPRPLRQYNEQLPKELERICQKAMAKRVRDRYSSAHDLADDLRRYLDSRRAEPFPSAASAAVITADTEQSATGATSTGSTARSTTSIAPRDSSLGPLSIAPKGLRAFDANDADFYLDLLPGTRGRDGLPESIRFWKSRIEQADPDKTFAVGILYGPSGCGKSSLFKAGLLPRLSEDVLPVYIEATPETTEERLRRALQKLCPKLLDSLPLTDAMLALRRGQGAPAGKKILVILDQFEQWLHGNQEDAEADLVQALRQCDGGRVQCIVMVRDDFWMAMTRFLNQLEVDLVQGENFAAFDLFPIAHAQKVLAAFGRAFGALPEDPKDASEEQQEFLKLATAGLAEEGKVISVRLALFAEMMKSKPWTPATLKAVGGTEGVGAAFLEETFSARVNPKHRLHQHAARAVLEHLLPETGSHIKGRMKSYDDLLEVSGYAERPSDFAVLVDILDHEIRFITPTDPEGAAADGELSEPAETGTKYFQLTHDYLVASLRDWLTRKQRETRRGRASLRLAERAALWAAKPERQFLPPWWEFLNIRLFTERKRWTASQHEMMRKAARTHGLRFVVLMLIVGAIGFVGVRLRDSIVDSQRRTRAEGLVSSLLSANSSEAPGIVADLEELRPWAEPLLQQRFQDAADASTEKLHVALALLPTDPAKREYLVQRLPACSIVQFPVLRDALRAYQAEVARDCWRLARDDHREAAERFQAAAVLADYDHDNAEPWSEIAPFVAEYVTGSRSSLQLTTWVEHLRPARDALIQPLSEIFSDRDRSPAQREAAAFLLADYLNDQPSQLVPLILLADEPVEFSVLSEALRPHWDEVEPELVGLMKARPARTLTLPERRQHWKRQSLAAATLLQLGDGRGVWPLLTFSPDPSRRSYIIHHLGKLQVNHQALARRLEIEPEVSVRRALIQSLGGQRAELLAPTDRERAVERMRDAYVNDPDPGVHGAAAWALRQWKEELPNIRITPCDGREDPWSWRLNSQGMTMVMLPSTGHDGDGPSERGLAISMHEVTVAQFNRFRKHEVIAQIAPTEDCPVHHITWYQAAEYCNWLSDQDNIPEDQWAYEPNSSGQYAAGMRIKENATELLGYRLPTGVEWEYACRLGTQRAYSFGAASELLDSYAHYVLNSDGRSHSVGSLLPNDAGLFDMHGNVWEWSQDAASGTALQLDNSEPRVMRGGSFLGLQQSVLATNQTASRPNNHVAAVGFRPVRTCLTTTSPSAGER